MSYYIATEAAIPLRATPQESSEMISQVLFGERLYATEAKGNWLYVKNEDDGYAGWLTSYMVTAISEDAGTSEFHRVFVYKPGYFLEDMSGGRFYLPVGASVPVGTGWEEAGKLKIGEKTWHVSPAGLIEASLTNDLEECMRTFLNVPYLWGGRSSFGIDCSGLTQVSFRICGRFLPRDSSQQWLAGTPISWEERQKGDLAFFAKPGKSTISHVGMLLEENEILHASGRVRIDPIQKEGIMRKEDKKLTHLLLGCKRF